MRNMNTFVFFNQMNDSIKVYVYDNNNIFQQKNIPKKTSETQYQRPVFERLLLLNNRELILINIVDILILNLRKSLTM
jgi:hypothetical protein